MKLLFDEQGHVVVEDGKPVYQYDDGEKKAFDAQYAVSEITKLNNEAKGHRLTAKEMADKLKVYEIDFDGIDAKKARDAIKIVSNLDAKKLIDAGEVEGVKAQLIEGFNVEKQKLITNFEEQKRDLENKVLKRDNHIFNMEVENRFYKSPLFTGNDPKTTMTADVAYEVFRKHFEVDSSGDRPRVVAKLDGEEILSRQKPGKPADFHEAMDLIWEKYPNRARYEQANNGGGGRGGQGDNKDTNFATPRDRIRAGLREK